MIQDIIFRVIPSLLFFVILPLISYMYILLVYLCLPAAVPHLSKGQTITLLFCRSPTFLTPHSSLRSFTVFSFSLSHCQLQGYHIMSASLPVRLSSLSVCLSASVLLLFCYQGWLPVYNFIKVTLIIKLVKCVMYSLIALIISSLVQTSRLTQTT